MISLEIIFLFIVVFIILPILFGLGLYFIPFKLGYKKTSKWLLRIYICLIGIFILYNIFSDYLFTKNDVKKLLSEQQIELKNPFMIQHNETSSFIAEYYHTFRLIISPQDKTNIINAITTHNNYIAKGGEYKAYPSINYDRDKYEGPVERMNYQTNDAYIRSLFKPNGKGYAPTFRIIKITKEDNFLIFEDIDY